MNFSDKKVLVTGGSRGIGRACAIGFAERGARVAVNYLGNREAAESTVNGLPGDRHVMLQADVSDPVAVESLVAAAVEALGGLDIVVNNAGIWVDHVLEDVDYDLRIEPTTLPDPPENLTLTASGGRTVASDAGNGGFVDARLQIGITWDSI